MSKRHCCQRVAVAALALACGLGAGPAAVAEPRSAARAEPAGKPPPRDASARPAPAEPYPLPAALLDTLRRSGVPLQNFGIHVRAVDSSKPSLSLNGEQPLLLASTAKLVTSSAALNLLGPTHQWRTQAYTTAPVHNGRTAGDLVIVGSTMGLTPAALREWFRRMRGEGLSMVGGRIVLERFALLRELQPAPAAASQQAVARPLDASTYNSGASVVVVQPSRGELASVSLQPALPGVVIVNEMLMGGASSAVCGARVRWGEVADTRSAAPPPLLVSGRWVADCGRQEVAFVKPPTAAATALAVGTPRSAVSAGATAPPRQDTGRRRPQASGGGSAPAASTASTAASVASLWAEAGGQLRGGVIEQPPTGLAPAKGRAVPAPPRAARAWTSQHLSTMPEVLRELNKTSNNDAARALLLSLATPATPGPAGAQGRARAWLGSLGLAGDDLVIDDGSGQSRLERGRPRAMVQLLQKQWPAGHAKVFVDSLPIAGVDGTLANRMRKGPASGRAFLKTGTLSDTRALAGYVLGHSGKVYAVALMVNHPQAGRATPALDALVEWLAKNG